MLCELIDVPETAHYSSLLNEMGLRRAEMIIDLQKMTYINNVLNNNGDNEKHRHGHNRRHY